MTRGEAIDLLGRIMFLWNEDRLDDGQVFLFTKLIVNGVDE